MIVVVIAFGALLGGVIGGFAGVLGYLVGGNRQAFRRQAWRQESQAH